MKDDVKTPETEQPTTFETEVSVDEQPNDPEPTNTPEEREDEPEEEGR